VALVVKTSSSSGSESAGYGFTGPIPIAVRMGQMWTDEMQADLERWQASLDESEATSTTATDMETLHVCDVLRGLAAYCIAVIRHKFPRGAPPVWSLAQEIDYATFTRRLREPLDPEIEALIDADLNIFEGVKCYNG
jgi:hypothetical protein